MLTTVSTTPNIEGQHRHTDQQPKGLNMNTTTPQQYKDAAAFNLLFAKMERMRGNHAAADAHRNLADVYIKQELRRHVITK